MPLSLSQADVSNQVDRYCRTLVHRQLYEIQCLFKYIPFIDKFQRREQACNEEARHRPSSAFVQGNNPAADISIQFNIKPKRLASQSAPTMLCKTQQEDPHTS